MNKVPGSDWNNASYMFDWINGLLSLLPMQKLFVFLAWSAFPSKFAYEILGHLVYHYINSRIRIWSFM